MASRPRRVVWTASARDGLDGILAYIAEESPDAAAKVLIESLGRFEFDLFEARWNVNSDGV